MVKPIHKKKIVVVGGGAGGLELVSRLARRYRRDPTVSITLVNDALTHIWKPHYHEIAAGTLPNSDDEINYLLHATNNGYDFRYGEMIGLDQASKQIIIKTQLADAAPETFQLSYDILIIAIGSITNHFNIPGVEQYCFTLDTLDQAQRFHDALLQHLLATQLRPQQSFNLVIIGGGATGIELAAELQYAFHIVVKHGFPQFNPDKNVTISLIEAAKSLLNQIPGDLPQQVESYLTKLPIKLYCDERVKAVTAKQIITQSGLELPFDLAVWVAGIRAPKVLASLASLEVNSISQLIVNQSLQTTLDPSIFAFGDCAYCPQPHSDKSVPPRAQAAHQQAKFLAAEIPKYLRGETPAQFTYHDHGSLISLSAGGGMGELMVRVLGEFKVRGFLARYFYRFLYFIHRVNILGFWQVFIRSLANLLTRHTRARLKLH